MAQSSGSDDKSGSFWSLLPSFDPSTDDIREFSQKARFLHGVLDKKQRPNLAPRLAMACKGTARHQVRQLDPEKLTDADNGVEHLLKALSAWEETSELKTYELFEKALYKVSQRPDEAAHSYALRLQAAFDDLGDSVDLKSMQAFILLRQSCLSSEDKKRVLAMTGGTLKTTDVDKAMRSLSTKVLLGTGEKKKIYPTNFAEPEETNPDQSEEWSGTQSTFLATAEEEDALTAEQIDSLASNGDEDALTIQAFEKDFSDMLQEIPDLQQAMVSYTDARARISERKKFRGFWPVKGRGKSKDAGGARSFRKGGARGGKDELLARISRTRCRICNAIGHWKAECPQRKDAAKETANYAEEESEMPPDPKHVIFEELDEPEDQSIREAIETAYICNNMDTHHMTAMTQALRKFWKPRLNKGGKGMDNRDNEVATPKKTPNKMPFATKSPILTAFSRNHLEPAAECFASQYSPDAVVNRGLAILDTGASRSVL